MLGTGAGQTCLASARNLFVCNRKLLRVSQVVPRIEGNGGDESSLRLIVASLIWVNWPGFPAIRLASAQENPLRPAGATAR
jgi:hypothetical protein